VEKTIIRAESRFRKKSFNSPSEKEISKNNQFQEAATLSPRKVVRQILGHLAEDVYVQGVNGPYDTWSCSR